MSNAVKKSQETSLQALYEELEARYGAGSAQEIVEQIKKTEEQNNKPEFMPEFMEVKALSEVLEVLRTDTKKLVRGLKNAKTAQMSADVINLDVKRIQNKLSHLFACYWLVQHGFYKAYTQAMKIYEVPAQHNDTYTKPIEMKMAA